MDPFEILRAVEWVRGNPTERGLLAMLAIVVIAIACLYMAFGQRKPVWLA